jgi:hypothetical protein
MVRYSTGTGPHSYVEYGNYRYSAVGTYGAVRYGYRTGPHC